MPRPPFFYKSRRKSKSENVEAVVPPKPYSKQQKQVTLSKFFNTKSTNIQRETQTSLTTEDSTNTEVKINSQRKRHRSNGESTESKSINKKSKVSDAGEGPSREQPAASYPLAGVNPGDLTNDSVGDGLARKVSDSTLEKLSSFISRSVMQTDGNLTPPDAEISLESVKQRLNQGEDKAYSTSQDSGIFSSQLAATESDEQDDEIKPESFALSSKLSKFSRPGVSSEKQRWKPSGAAASQKKVKYTPLEQQFVEIKQQYQDAVLFVECGYKYRFFGEDAEIAARELNIFCHLDHSFMTASIPVHRLHVHVRRLVAKGYKVGVVKQTETAALKAAGDNRLGPFSRQLSALYTKSTLIGEDVDTVSDELDTTSVCASAGTFLLTVYEPDVEEKKGQPHKIAVVAIHPSTGDLVYDEFEDTAGRSELEMRIAHIGPVEVLLPQTLSTATEKTIKQIISYSTTPEDKVRLERLPDSAFCHQEAIKNLTDFYNGKSDTSARVADVLQLPKPVTCCLAGLLHYLKEFKLQNVLSLTSQFVRFTQDAGCLRLNASTLQNLEIFRNGTDGKDRGSLFWVIDQTSTKFGRRKLRQWLAKPLINICDIEERLDAVQCVVEDSYPLLVKLKSLLHTLPDLEKGLGTVYHQKCSTGEFLSICRAFQNVSRMIQMETVSGTDTLRSSLLVKIFTELPELLEDVEDWTTAIDEKAARDGDKTQLFVREAEFPEVVQRKQEIQAVLQQLKDHRKDVRLSLRMPALDYVTVSGVEFLVEVKNANLKVVPQDWTKISSTKTVSRFHTPVIVMACKKLGQLKEQLQLDCNQAWKTFLQMFEDCCYLRYKQAVQHLAVLDCLISLGKLARQDGYTRPSFVEDEAQICVSQGRHPVVNALLEEQEQFVPNDTDLQCSGCRCMIITGPNMGGKSSYIKQVCLVVIMAQMGSYIPADSATLSMFDAIYTRMGASDELFKGRSTFMVELQEASDIMASATSRSLVILDELGRGTSTHDGVAIAHATLKHFIEQVQCLTLFVTHYPSLTELESIYPTNLGNYHMAFMVNDDSKDYHVITFLYQLVHGKADSSYGLNVARLAELPPEILQVAAHKSRQLEMEVMGRRKQRHLFCRLMSGDPETLTSLLVGVSTAECMESSS